MEFNTQFTSTSTQTMPSETSAGISSSADARPVQPKIFPESDVTHRSATTPHNQSVRPPPNTNAPPQHGVGKNAASADQTLSREKRGAALGACAKSEFRECRGGEALKDGASSYLAFDQFDKKETRGEEGRGTCDGIIHETMRRIDRSAAGATTDLPSAVTYIRSEINGGATAAQSTLDRIQAFQDRPESLGLNNYHRSTTRQWNPQGGATQEERTDGVIHNMGTSPGMPPGGIAYIGVRVQRPGEAPQSHGHALLVQRLPSDAHGDASRYAIFDPNNGAFTYPDWQHTEAALQNYMHTAFNEDGYNAAPDLLRLYVPNPGHGDPPYTSHSRHGTGDEMGEPPEVGQRPHLGHDEL